VHRLRRQIWGAKRTVVLLISEQLRAGQTRGLQQHLDQRLRALAEWKQQLAKPRSGPRSQKSADKQVEQLRAGQYIKEVLHVDFDSKRSGADRLRYWVDEEARTHLETEVFGKRILLTNREQWSTEEIVLAYRGQHHVEAVFRQCKDDRHLAVRPQFHWTDQKIQVHTFICLLALLLARVVERKARKLQRTESLSGLLDLLGNVRLAMVLQPSGQKGGRPRSQWQLEAGNQDAVEFFRQIVPDSPPFVYTDGSS
jgi:transposase